MARENALNHKEWELNLKEKEAAKSVEDIKEETKNAIEYHECNEEILRKANEKLREENADLERDNEYLREQNAKYEGLKSLLKEMSEKTKGE